MFIENILLITMITMKKFKFVGEYEVRASCKMIYPYLHSPSGLADWFAEEVKVVGDYFDFIWDKESHKGRITSQRLNKSVRFEFLPESKEDEIEPAFIEFRIENNEITGSTFLKITDFSSMDDKEELTELWGGLVHTLKERIGG